MIKKITLFSLLALLFSVSSIFAQTAAITPIRTDVSGFSSWTDTAVTGTTYLQLLSAASKIITPTLDFTSYSAETLDFKIRTFGGTFGSSNVVTVSVSTNNGSTYTSLGTRTAANSTLTAVTQFSLSSYTGSQIKIKFESLSATGTIGLGIDDISINGVAACNAPTTQATFGTTTVNSTSLTPSFNVGNGTGRLVLINTTNSFTDPSNGTAYTANATYAGSGQQVVYANTSGTSVAVTNLSSSTTYYFAIYEYNCSGTSIIYNLTENTSSASTTIAGCNTGALYPSATYTPLNNGTAETITNGAATGEYSVIDIPSTDNVYRFSTSVSTDFITITSSNGSTIYASGVTPLTWTSTVASTIRYYIHLSSNCTFNSTTRSRYIQTVSTACSSPSSPTAINITSNSALISWTAPANAPSSGYEVYYAVASTAPTNTTAGNFTTANSYFIGNLSSLNSNTTYYYWVRSKCGTAKSPWVAGGTFRTLLALTCNTATYGLYPTTTFTPNYSGVEEQIATDCFAAQYSNVNILAGKQYVFRSSASTDYITITNEAGSTVYASGTTPVTWTSGTNTGIIRYYIHFDSSCSSSNTNRTKSITSSTPLSCGAPTGLTAAHITSNSAYVQVTAPSPSLTVSQYYVYINTTGNTPISSTQPTATSTTTSIFLSGLQANTPYFYWVSSSCSGSSSAWVAGGAFTTLATISSSCNGATYGLNPSTVFTPAGTGNLELITNASAASQFSYITISADKTYTFQSDIGTDYITITNEAGTTVITKGSSPLTWNSNATLGRYRYYIHSQVACGSSTSARSKYVKCVSLCNAPTGISVSNIGSRSASFSWASLASGYQCYLSPTNTPPLDTAGTTDNYTTTNSFTTYGLTPTTTYYSWVRSACGFGNSAWVSAGSFTTLAGGCTSGTLYPTTTFTPALTGAQETITTQTWAGEYSNVTIQSGKTYMFTSSIASDYITITDATGTAIYAYGKSPLAWSSGTNSGTLRYYIHTSVFCTTQNSNRTRYIRYISAPCSTPAPDAVDQTVCTGATIANLVATGTNVKWYDVSYGGTALASTTALTTGTYFVTQTTTCESYVYGVYVNVSALVTPTFTQVAAICSGASLAALPITSTNYISGTWSPAINNLQTTTYTFTPASGGCATTTTMTITVNPKSTPTFAQVAPINSGGSLSALPTTSTNSITGTWSAALNNTATTTYTFNPTAGTCAYPAYLTIVVNSVAPNISYAASTQAFTVGLGISQLTPANTGGAVPDAIYQYVSTFAGSANVTGDADGTGIAASFSQPTGLAIDALGNLFVGDKNNYKIREITSSGVVSTLAGSLASGATDGIGTAATFSEPTGVSVDASSNVFVADRYNNSIRKVTPDGVVSTFADANAGLTRPSGVAVDASGNVYVADSNNNKIKKITSAGVVSTFAGSGTYASTDGTGAAATFKAPNGIAVDRSGNVYVADTYGNKIRKITPAGVVTTIAGNDVAGNSDGTGTNASFSSPNGVAVDVYGNIYVADTGNHFIRKITPAGVVTTMAGLSSTIYEGIAPYVRITYPMGITTDQFGNVYATENYRHTIRKLSQYGYSISPSLPAGLSIDGTGTITGTPTVSSPLTTYTITAYNTGGSSSTNIRLAVCTSKIAPTFTQVAPICAGASLSSLPTISDNGITGTWSPAPNNTTTTTYTFTPTAGLCAINNTMTITVNPTSTPTFTQVAPICAGVYLADLPTTSNNGVTGTWSPAMNNTATTTYTFTGLCQTSTSMTIVVNPSVTITFPPVAPICAGASLAALPTTSSSGFTGTWSPAINNTVTKTYLFTPTAGQQCSVSTPLTITVHPLPTATLTTASGICPGSSASITANVNVGVFSSQAISFAPLTAPTNAVSLADGGVALVPLSSGDLDDGGWGAVPIGFDFNFFGTTYSTINISTNGTVMFGAYSLSSIRDYSFTTLPSAAEPLNMVAVLAKDNDLRTATGGALKYWTEGVAPNRKFVVTYENVSDFYVNNTVPKFSTAQAVFYETTGVIEPHITSSTNQNQNKLVGVNNSNGTIGVLAYQSGIAVSSVTQNPISNSFAFRFSPNTDFTTTWKANGVDVAGEVAQANHFTLPVAPSATTTYSLSLTSTATGCTIAAGSATVDLTVNPYTTPTFTQVSPIATGTTLSALPTTSNNGFTGTWSPDLNNLATTTYTFTPTAGQCATTTAMSILVGNVPAISYLNNTQTYNVGSAITAISPNNTGGAVPAIVFGQTSTLAGSGAAASADGTGAAASFSRPTGVALDAAGNTYVADQYNHKIRKITPAGVVSTFAGSGSVGSADGTGTAASFNLPFGLTVDAAGNVFVADSGNNKIRKITPAGVVSTFAGSGAQGAADGPATAASFYFPTGVKLDTSGNLFVADFSNHKIRKISPTGDTSTFAGSGSTGSADGTGTAASFFDPVGIEMDAAGNLYIADKSNQKIRKITAAGVVSTFAGSGAIGAANGASNVASFNYPQGVAIDRLGQIYVADGSNNLIRKISTSGVVSTLAGSGIAGAEEAAGTSARLSLPINLTVDSDLTVYVADYFNNKIRKIAQPNGGYSISPALPSGLSFNSTNAQISGTPTAAKASTTYTVTGYNEFGSGSTTLSITTIPNILLTGAGVGGWVEAGMVALSSTDGISFTKSRVEILGSGGASSEVKFTEGTWASALGNSSSLAGSGFPTGTASVSGSNIAATPGFWNVSYNYQTKAYSFTASSSPNPVINLSGTAVGSTAVTLSTTDG
ncbi:MAG: hypothetical protein CFE24_14335, partial [Flavobacterium sp. BFFFF2]